jgi:hypothetical protein
VEGKLKNIEVVKNSKSKGTLFHKCGIQEGMIHGWMKEEEKLVMFVDFIEDDIALQRKKTRLCENSDVDKCLYKWFI